MRYLKYKYSNRLSYLDYDSSGRSSDDFTTGYSQVRKLFRIYNVPSSPHVLHMRMASVEHVVFLLLNAIKLQTSHLFFSLHLHSQLHFHGSSFVTKNCLQRQLSWLSSCLSNLYLSSLHSVILAAPPSIKQAP